MRSTRLMCSGPMWAPMSPDRHGTTYVARPRTTARPAGRALLLGLILLVGACGSRLSKSTILADNGLKGGRAAAGVSEPADQQGAAENSSQPSGSAAAAPAIGQ